MSEQNEEEALSSWEEEVEFFVNTLKESFESTDANYSVDEQNNILYIELEGLQDYSNDEIVEIAEPIFEIAELDFEDIILMPLK
ncbi:hypothetical protein [Rhodohalobacter halophilus]|uniref:hypothetical protein n=1 Tax=Rhodohalobacter halophilus TaxID=1812810 RepID=UPI00083F6F2F|nr:hypothetical protein [Rhodohalobacter halophilus]